MPSAALTAPVGPNPAAIAELAWHLVRREGVELLALHLVLESQRSLHYAEAELLGPDGALAELRALCPDRVPAEDRVVLHRALARDGSFPPHERHHDVADAMCEPLWTAARNAQAEAGEAPVWFGLTGGRRRVSTAAQTMVFQLLGRPQDRLVDVRTSQPVASGGSGFFFPEQRERDLRGRFRHEGVPFDAREVEIWVEPLRVPRLRPLLAEADLRTYADAMLAADRTVLEATPPEVVVDLLAGTVEVEGHPVKLTGLQRAVYLHVLAAHARREAPVRSVDYERLVRFVKGLPGRAGWAEALPDWVLTPKTAKRIRTEEDRMEALQQGYSKTRRRVEDALVPVLGERARFVVPRPVKGDLETTQHLSVPPERVRLRGERGAPMASLPATEGDRTPP